jgi:AcrR family transcriptional regulator
MATPTRPLRADAERNRARILAAAGRLFAERGLDVTLDAVAEEAGVGVGTVYRRFADKEQLIDALFEERIAAITAHAEAGLAVEDPWDGVVLFLERALELNTADRGLTAVLLCAGRGAERVAQAREQIAPIVARLIARAQQAGQLRGDLEPTDMPLLQFMLTAAAGYAHDVQPEIWRRLLGIVLDGLRPARDGATPLPVPALTQDEFERVMASARL